MTTAPDHTAPDHTAFKVVFDRLRHQGYTDITIKEGVLWKKTPDAICIEAQGVKYCKWGVPAIVKVWFKSSGAFLSWDVLDGSSWGGTAHTLARLLDADGILDSCSPARHAERERGRAKRRAEEWAEAQRQSRAAWLAAREAHVAAREDLIAKLALELPSVHTALSLAPNRLVATGIVNRLDTELVRFVRTSDKEVEAEAAYHRACEG